jgi:hypothetical protein
MALEVEGVVNGGVHVEKGHCQLIGLRSPFPAPLGLSGGSTVGERAKEFPDPSYRTTDAPSIPRPLRLTMPSCVQA